MPSVVIIGAGLGGLCLAQGLRTAGIPVQVYERDARPGSRWEGYRDRMLGRAPVRTGG